MARHRLETDARGAGQEPPSRLRVTLRQSLDDDLLDVMNFLNEVVMRYPDAISFAPGRPAEAFFDVEASLGHISSFAEARAAASQRSRSAVFRDLGQYGKTNGLIQDLVACHLRRDEGIDVDPESIMVTAGCQEAMLILLLGLFEPASDVLMVSDPTYIGITGLARLLGVELWPLACGDEGLRPETVLTAVEEIRRKGKRPVAVYDIPDFNNPQGTSMPLDVRRRLLELASELEILIFEDNPYGMFAFDADPTPTLKSLDVNDDPGVIYLGTFSKTLYPGLRLGYLVADQRLPARGDADGAFLAQELSRIKSLTTVNTSPLAQAIAGGVLEKNQGSLRSVVEGGRAFYKANRDAMLRCLEDSMRRRGLDGKVSWNRPGGGFFLTVTLPFDFDEECLQSCAGEYGVICCPMSFFSLSTGRERQIRLSFSYVTEAEIATGIGRLAHFVADRMRQ